MSQQSSRLEVRFCARILNSSGWTPPIRFFNELVSIECVFQVFICGFLQHLSVLQLLNKFKFVLFQSLDFFLCRIGSVTEKKTYFYGQTTRILLEDGLLEGLALGHALLELNLVLAVFCILLLILDDLLHLRVFKLFLLFLTLDHVGRLSFLIFKVVRIILLVHVSRRFLHVDVGLESIPLLGVSLS